MNEKLTPPWADELSEDQFISYGATYTLGTYFNLYEKGSFPADEVGVMNYYFYDPTKHGYPADKAYPLLVFLHGSSNALEGDICINYSGAEMYASPSYQKTMGGAYILIPLANESRNEEGKTVGGWAPRYIMPVLSLIKEFEKGLRTKVSKRFAFGNSSGATFCQILVEAKPSFFKGCIPIGSGYVPGFDSMRAFNECGVHLFFAISRHDEFHSFTKEIEPAMDRLEMLDHRLLYFPEWTMNGDGGVASINFGVEMGQHCLINMMQANLVLDDGTPLDERLPEGVTGWIAKVCKEE